MFEVRDKAAVVMLSATAPFFSCSHLKARNPALRRVGLDPGICSNHCLITCDPEGDGFLASPEI